MKKLIVLLAIMAMVAGCNKPPEIVPPPGTVTIAPDQGRLLTAAVNTGCTLAKTALSINSYWPMIHPFIPGNILNTAVPVLNAFNSGLRLYLDAVVMWSDTKQAPQNFDQIKTNLLALKDSAMPIIQQIIALAAGKPTDVVAAAGATKAMIEEKAMFTCTIDELKALSVQIKELPVLT